MLAPLLALTLVAGSGSGSAENGLSERCTRIFRGVEKGKDYQADIFGDVLHRDAARNDLVKKHFVDGCANQTEDDVACGEKHAGRTIFRDCAALGRVFRAAVTADDVVGGPELSKLAAEGLSNEARENLRNLGQAARLLRLQSGPSADFSFPKTVPATPAVNCCELPAHACPVDARLWTHPTWKALGFAPAGQLRFHYTFASSGTGKDASFVIRAEGDPNCDGHPLVFEVAGQSDGKQFVVSSVQQR